MKGQSFHRSSIASSKSSSLVMFDTGKQTPPNQQQGVSNFLRKKEKQNSMFIAYSKGRGSQNKLNSDLSNLTTNYVSLDQKIQQKID